MTLDKAQQLRDSMEADKSKTLTPEKVKEHFKNPKNRDTFMKEYTKSIKLDKKDSKEIADIKNSLSDASLHAFNQLRSGKDISALKTDFEKEFKLSPEGRLIKIDTKKVTSTNAELYSELSAIASLHYSINQPANIKEDKKNKIEGKIYGSNGVLFYNMVDVYCNDYLCGKESDDVVDTPDQKSFAELQKNKPTGDDAKVLQKRESYRSILIQNYNSDKSSDALKKMISAEITGVVDVAVAGLNKVTETPQEVAKKEFDKDFGKLISDAKTVELMKVLKTTLENTIKVKKAIDGDKTGKTNEYIKLAENALKDVSSKIIDIENKTKQDIVKKAEEKVKKIGEEIRKQFAQLDEGKLRPSEIDDIFKGKEYSDYPAIAQGILGTENISQTMNLLYDFGKNKFKDVDKTILKQKNDKDIKLSNNADKRLAKLLVGAVAINNKAELATKGKLLIKLNENQMNVIGEKDNVITVSENGKSVNYAFLDGTNAANPFKALKEAGMFDGTEPLNPAPSAPEVVKTTPLPAEIANMKLSGIDATVIDNLNKITDKAEAGKYFGEAGSEADPKYADTYQKIHEFMLKYDSAYNILPIPTKPYESSPEYTKAKTLILKLISTAYPAEYKELGKYISAIPASSVNEKGSYKFENNTIFFGKTAEKVKTDGIKEIQDIIKAKGSDISEDGFLAEVGKKIESSSGSAKELLQNIYLSGILIGNSGNTDNKEFGVLALTGQSDKGLIKGLSVDASDNSKVLIDKKASINIQALNLKDGEIKEFNKPGTNTKEKIKVKINLDKDNIITKMEIVK